MVTQVKFSSLSDNRCALIVALVFTLFYNWPFFFAVDDVLHLWTLKNSAMVLSVSLWMLCVLNFVFQLLAWPWLTKPVFTTLIIFSGTMGCLELRHFLVWHASVSLCIPINISAVGLNGWMTGLLIVGFLLVIIPLGYLWSLKLQPVHRWSRFLLDKSGYLFLSLLGLACLWSVYQPYYQLLIHEGFRVTEEMAPLNVFNAAYRCVRYSCILPEIIND